MLPAVGHMNMAVAEILGAVCIHQIVKAGKSHMGNVASVIDLVGGRMSQQNIKTMIAL